MLCPSPQPCVGHVAFEVLVRNSQLTVVWACEAEKWYVGEGETEVDFPIGVL
jgi:hypothetical protein